MLVCFVCGHLSNRRAPPTDWHRGIKEEGPIPGSGLQVTSRKLTRRPRRNGLFDTGF